jgi:hypothetical protein
MKAIVKFIFTTFSIFTLIACGGGGTLERDNDSDDSDTNDITISLNIVNQDDVTDRNLTIDNPLTVVATVKYENGGTVADTLVTFTIEDADLAVFSNDTGTARTNDNGVAELMFTVGTISGDGQIVATIASGETATTTFSAEGTAQDSELPATLELYASAVQLASSGLDEIELIAVVKNSQSVLMEGVDVSFSAAADDGVEIQLDQPTTEADGTARAILTSQNNAANRTVTVTAQTTYLTQTVSIGIVGTEVVIDGASSMILGDSVELTLQVQDSDGVAITEQAIALSAENGTLSSTSVTSGADGQAEVTYTGTTSGIDIITASALNATTSFSISVQEDEFSFTTVPAEDVPLDEVTELTVTWNKDGAPYVGGVITFSASRGDISAADTTTDVSGQASFTLSSTNAGVSAITATGIDSDGNEVSARIEMEFIATEPDSIQADASPDLIGPDGETSTITAIVRDDSGNLVKGAIVSFNVDDVSTGSISPSQATTGSNGIATTVFTSGSVTSEDAVVITAQISDDVGVSDSVYLTVGNRAFDISIGTGNLIESPDDTTYLKEFAIFVTDSVGQPIEGVSLTASTTPVKYTNDGQYRKGYWVWEDPIWVPYYTASCDNEDINANGILDEGEDTNGDTFLTPGIVGTVTFQDSNLTDENGQAVIEIRYPRNYASFYDAEITVFAQSTGSEASAATNYTFSVATDDINDEDVSPPVSPFGINSVCTDNL